MSVCCECCVLSGRGLCDGMIPRPESRIDSVCVCVCVCVRVCVRERERLNVVKLNNNPLHLQRVGIIGQAKTEISAGIIFKLPGTGSFIHSIKSPPFLSGYTFIDYLSNCYVFKQWCTPWSKLLNHCSI